MDQEQKPHVPPPVQPNETPHQPVNPAKVSSVYPQVTADPPEANKTAPPPVTFQPEPETKSQIVSTAFLDIMALILGLASPILYLVLLYKSKSKWTTITVCSVLAVVAILCAVKSYRDNGKLTPVAVIGISGATIGVVNVVNLLVLENLISTSFGS